MKLKGMLKLALSALLLAGGASAFAQDADAEEALVQLGNGKGTITWTQFATNINNPEVVTGSVIDSTSTVAVTYKNAKIAYDNAVRELESLTTAANNAEQSYNDSKEDYDRANTKLQTLNSDNSAKGAAGWLVTILNYALDFQDAFNLDDKTSTAKIYYKKADGRGVVLDVAFNLTDASGWNQAKQGQFYDYITNADGEGISTINTLRIYMGDDYMRIAQQTTPNATQYMTVNGYKYDPLTIANDIVAAINNLTTQPAYQENKNQAQIDALNALIADYDTKDGDKYGYKDEAKTQPRNKLEWLSYQAAQAKADKEEAETNVTNTKAAYDAARTAYDNANKELDANKTSELYEAYNSVTLLGNIDATTPITASYAGLINGNGYVIDIKIADSYTQKTLFNAFAGHLINTAINGSFALTTLRGQFEKVAYANPTDEYYRFYDENGALYDKNITNLGELGFVARDYFGANLASGYLTEKGTYKVYSVTYYKPGYSNQQYVNLVGGKIVNADEKEGYTIEANAFMVTETSDFATDSGFENVIYYNASKNAVCDKVNLSDKKDFYCPIQFTAASLSYERTFAAGYNSICLPFDVTAATFSNVKALCSYHSQTNSSLRFNIVDKIEANTPGLIYLEEEYNFTNQSDVTMNATPAQKIEVRSVVENDNSLMFGVYQLSPVSASSYADGSYYGLAPNSDNTGYHFAKAGQGAKFPAFRMAIYCPAGTSTVAMHAPSRSIMIVDEDGEDITDSIEGIKADKAGESSSLDIRGGYGEITIISDADFGKVEVYTIEGRVAATVNVKAGTNSVNVAGGVYIVNGNKVMVK